MPNFKLSPDEKAVEGNSEKLINSMKITAVNRYNASNRLRMQSKFNFGVTTLFSLGLIFIPLMQLAKVELALNNDLLGAIQVFLAVAILVYSIITGTARFEIRSEQLNDCGDEIKYLIRKVRIHPQKDESEVLKKYQEKYKEIISDVENHSRADFILTQLREEEIFTFSWYAKVYGWIKFLFFSFIPYLTGIILILIEGWLIMKMFNFI